MQIGDSESGQPVYRKLRKRREYAGTARSLTFSCYQGFPFLAKDRTRGWFVESLKSARNKHPVDLWAWVIMPEHVHLLVNPREENVIGKFQASLKESVARRAVAWLEANNPRWIPRVTVREGHRVRRRFWQPGGGYDRNIEQNAALLATIDYLHHNPVRRGLAEAATDWRWSSARWYAGHQDCLIEMDRTLPTIYE